LGTPTYVALANLTLSSSAASVTFSSISQAYRDLVLVMTPKGSGFAAGPWLSFNGSTLTYSWVYAEGSGSATASGTDSGSSGIRINPENYISAANDNQVFTVQIMDYSATDKHKTVLGRYGTANAGVGMSAGRWSSTAAITSLKLDSSPTGSTMAAGSTFALYGIVA